MSSLGGKLSGNDVGNDDDGNDDEHKEGRVDINMTTKGPVKTVFAPDQ